MGGVWPLTGRAEELRFVEGALRRKNGPQGVVLAGAAGVGKTRLAREALAVASRRGAKVRWVPATASARALPLGAFAGVLNVTGPDSGLLVQRATTALLDGAGPGGVVVAVDDAHLLDDLSALVVQHLAVQRAAAVVVTLRSDEPTPDAVTALWKDRYLDRLEVQPLSETETAVLLEAVLGGQVDTATAGRLFDLARGSALYLRQLVDGGLRSGRLRRVGGVWRWEGPSVVSQSLAELIETRMGSLPEPVREVVDLLVFGEPLPVSVLGRLTDPAVVEQAEMYGVVSVSGEDGCLQARLAHPLYGEVRRRRTGRLRAGHLCRRLASALGAVDECSTDVLRRAVLMLDAVTATEAEDDVDPVVFTAAAQRSLELCDPELAARLAAVAVHAGGGFEPHFLLVYALCLARRGDVAESEAAELAARASSDPQRVQAAMVRAANLFWTLGRPVQAAATLDAVESTAAVLGVGPDLKALRSAIYTELGRPAYAIEAATDALRSASMSDPSRMMAIWGLVLGLAMVGRVDEIEPLMESAEDAATRTGIGRILMLNFWNFHLIALRLGGYQHKAEVFAQERRDHQSQMQGHGPLVAVLLQGRAALGRGKLRLAQQRLREASAGFVASRQLEWEFLCRLDLTQALAMSGDGAAVEQELSACEAAIRDQSVFRTIPWIQPETILTRAWVAAAQGTLSRAIVLAHEAADFTRSSGQYGYEVYALHTAVCFGDRTVAERLAELAEVVDGPRAPAAAAQAAALAADDGHALLAASEELERMGDLRAAADAAAQAAVAHTKHGLRGSANVALARAHRLAEECEGARTPALSEADRPLPISARQREIAVLVAQGLSNQQIADRLTMSVRTVEGHIYRAAIKLGVTTRTELAALVQEERSRG